MAFPPITLHSGANNTIAKINFSPLKKLFLEAYFITKPCSMKNSLWLKSIIFGLALALSSTIFAQEITLPEGVTQGPSVEGITEYRLDNGLSVLLFPDQSKPTITVNITYLVGSRHEGYGETGMAHLLEHLVFKGTPDHPDIPQELTEHGARPNGTTWYDRTNYFETFSATEENLRWALDLESDRMINSFIAKEDLESEMTVVRNEFESGENSPSSVLMKRVMGAAFQWHNYGKSTIGARADIENVPIERLQAFYRRYYQPDNAVLVVAGKIDEQETLEMVHEYFSPIPKPERELIPTYTKEPTQDGEREVTLRRVGDVQALSVVYHTPPGPHPDYASVAVIEELLTNEPAGRLYKALVETKKASSVWGFAPGLKEGGFIYMGADVRKENSLEEAKDTLLTTLDALAENPPTEEEIERAKARILKNWELNYTNSDRVGRGMSEYIAQGDWRLFFLFRDNVENVTVENVVEVAKKYFKPSNRTVGLFIPKESPDRAEIPDPPNVKALVGNYEGKEAIAVGEAFDPSPENIESRTKRDEAANGMELALLSKETRGDIVELRMSLRFGDEESLKGKSMAASMAGAMLDKGTTSMTRQEIQDKFDALKAQVNVSGGQSSAYVRIQTDRNNLKEVIAIVADMLKNPAFDEEEFEKLKAERLAGIESNLSEPTAIANNEFGRLLNPYPKGDIRYIETMEEEIESIKAVTLEEAKAFHEEFYGTSDATVAIVGDFDERIIEKEVKAQFADWESPMKFERIDNPFIEAKVENKNINTPDKANAMFLAGMNIPIDDEHPDYPAMVLGNYMLGGGFLNSRLATRIRQKEGISYGVGSFFNASALDESATFGAYAIYAPENVDRLEKAFREEIEKVQKEGFSAEEVEAAKSGWLQSRTVSRSQDASLAGTLNSYLYLDRDMMWDAELEQKIQALTPEQINRAMQKHIDLSKMAIVKAGDFEKAEKDKVIKP